jgi:hypothetical protein
MRWIFTQVLGCVLAPVVLAAGLSGTWKGSIETAIGKTECTIVLKAEGQELSGSVLMDVFGAAIENGKIIGDKISFAARMDFGTLTYDGTVAGDEIKFIVSAPDGSYAPMNCRRQK